MASTSETVSTNSSSENSPENLNTVKRRRMSRNTTVKTKNLTHIFQFSCRNNDPLQKFAICLLCKTNLIKKEIKMTNCNTTGLPRHLSKYHPIEYDAIYLQIRSTDEEIENFNQEEFCKMVIDWMALKYLPFNFFSDDLTRKMFKYLNAKVVLPKRSAMREIVIRRFKEKKSAIVKILSEQKSKFSFTIDGWTAINNKSYYGITCHFICASWILHSIVIDFVPSFGKHAGKDMAKIFLKTLEDYKISKNIQGITVDNTASNTLLMIELENRLQTFHNIDFDSIDQHFRCLAHIFNLGVQSLLQVLGEEKEAEDLYDCGNYRDKDEELNEDTNDEENDNEDESEIESEDDDEEEDEDEDTAEEIEEIESKPLLVKLRMLFKKIKKSEKLRMKFNLACKSYNIKPLATILDVSTRWNSTYDMLATAITLKKALNSFCECYNLTHLRISDGDWKLLEDITPYLKLFKEISTELGGEKYVTISSVIVKFNQLLDVLEEEVFHLRQKPNRLINDIVIEDALEAGVEKMMRHYNKTNWMYCVAVILDPRYKTVLFQHTKWGKEMEKEAIKKFESVYRTKYYKELENESPTTTTTTTIVEDALQRQNSSNRLSLEIKLPEFPRNIGTASISETESWKEEINHYISSKLANKNEDILNWWAAHEKNYPTLSRMAADFLCTPATSVPAERLFSRAALTIRKHRNRLTPESAQPLLCLNSWASCSLTNQIESTLENFEGN